MRTIKRIVLHAKDKAKKIRWSGRALAGGALLSVCPAYCDINGNSAMQKFLKTMFSIMVFAGIVLIAAGAASLIRTIVSMASGEQAQPGALGKGIGLIGPHDNDILLSGIMGEGQSMALSLIWEDSNESYNHRNRPRKWEHENSKLCVPLRV